MQNQTQTRDPYYSSEIGLWYTVWWDSEERDPTHYEWHWLKETRVRPVKDGYYASDDPQKLWEDFSYFQRIGIDYLLLDDTNNHLADNGNIARHIDACFKTAEEMGRAPRMCLGGGSPLLNNDEPGMVAELNAFYRYAERYPDHFYFLDGKPFDGGKAEGHSLELGSGSFIPGFEEQLVGTKAGDEKELNVTFPEDYHAAELAGKPVVFKVKVHEVKAKELPEVDDEFAKDVSEFDTLADFKKDLGEKLKERRETQNQRDFEAALMEQVMDNMEVEIPDAMVEYEADNLVNDMAQRIQAQGIPFDQYLAMTGMTMDIMREQAKAAALERVRRELALGAIVAAENITISDEELEEEYKRLAEQYHMEVDKVKAAVTADSIRKEQSYHKAEHVVYDSAKVGKAPAKKKSTKKKAEESAEGEEKPKKTARKGTSRKKVEETAEAAVEKTEE